METRLLPPYHAAMRRILVVALSLSVVALLTGARQRAVSHPASLTLDPFRSFVVTDQAMLTGFSFQRVMDAIVARSGTGTTALQLYQQMFDTQNPKPGLVAPSAPHCDDFLVDGKPAFNGLPRRCPTPEGVLATSNPFAANDYVPIGVLNRFDLAAPDGSNCGQFRIIFANVTDRANRLHLIFEAVLPNPQPESGLAGCRPVARFWADLSRVDSISERRPAVEGFFFQGIPGFAPVLDPAHFAPASGGGIRSMQQTSSAGMPERFYQFRLAKSCAGDSCVLIAQPDGLENLPLARFFDASYDTPAARAFREEFLRQIPTLAVRDVNLYFMNVSPEFLMAESVPTDDSLDFDFIGAFVRSTTTPAGRAFEARIAEELKNAGSALTPRELVLRADTQSCVGCHVLSGDVGEGVAFPPSLGTAEHLSEHVTEGGEAGLRFMVSPAMRHVFIPHRMEILRNFLQRGTPPVHSNMTAGGGRVH